MTAGSGWKCAVFLLWKVMAGHCGMGLVDNLIGYLVVFSSMRLVDEVIHLQHSIVWLKTVCELSAVLLCK